MKTTNDYTLTELLGKKVKSKVDSNRIGFISAIRPYPLDRYDSYDVTWSKEPNQKFNPMSIGCFHGFEKTFLEIVEDE